MHTRLIIASKLALLGLTLLGGCAGCGREVKGHTVRGKVAFKGKPGRLDRLVGGKVRFQSTSDPNLMPEGVIEEEGAFVMNTFLPSEKKAMVGVPAGQYKARVEPPLEEGKPVRGLILPKYESFDKSGLTVTVPVSGELVIEVERTGG